MPYLLCGARNQSVSTPSSETRLSTPFDPMIEVLIAPAQHQESDDHDERLKQQLQRHRAGKIHRNAADQVVQILRPDVVGDERVGEERDKRREQQRIHEDHEPGAHQILVLRVFELAVDLGE